MVKTNFWRKNIFVRFSRYLRLTVFNIFKLKSPFIKKICKKIDIGLSIDYKALIFNRLYLSRIASCTDRCILLRIDWRQSVHCEWDKSMSIRDGTPTRRPPYIVIGLLRLPHTFLIMIWRSFPCFFLSLSLRITSELFLWTSEITK